MNFKIGISTILAATLMALSLVACSEDKLEVYNTSYTALNIAKGSVFGNAELYPEEYSFNVYFLGSNISNYTLNIPVRLQGTIDYDNDRHYNVALVSNESKGMTDDLYTMTSTQTFRRGLAQDTLKITIHLDRMSTTDDYKARIALVPNDDFKAGVPEYQYVDISFTKNLSIAPNFWNNNSKLRKIAYSPRKCAVFLQISGLTDPDWVDDGSSVILDHWISLCQQWFLTHEEYDEKGNRIYFN
jgi:hypothetical protein